MTFFLIVHSLLFFFTYACRKIFKYYLLFSMQHGNFLMNCQLYLLLIYKKTSLTFNPNYSKVCVENKNAPPFTTRFAPGPASAKGGPGKRQY